eukprot:TRINITY_DN30981_c0_g1_i1.p1 TRINITY_DN30981_c0_g1~~TRINITY_DN30981_c0_g1_i1.p1  ORF type:complete len:222 (+),score=15.57 TRINITY_DN30981_c0_g1_i1:90-668(+)
MEPKMRRENTTTSVSTGISDLGGSTSNSDDESVGQVCTVGSARTSRSSLLSSEYPKELIEHNTFLCLVEPELLSGPPLRRVKSEPNTISSLQAFRRDPSASTVPLLPIRCESGPCLLTEPPPSLGSPEMPTIGSALHAVAQCKPCAFVGKARGCSNGTSCPFCHLCDAGEKKRRQKEKKALWKAQSHLQMSW